MKDDDHLSDTVEDPHPGIPEGENGMEEEVVDDTVEMLPLQDEFDKVKQERDEARMKLDQHWDTIVRLRAEQENLRKRSARDIDNAHKYALERFSTDLLPVKDSLEMGIVAAGEAVDAARLKEGAELTLKMLVDVMAKYGIEEVNPEGERFNPENQQAMTMRESGDVEPNTVLSVMQKGYLLNGRLIRPAMVIVSKAPA